VQGPERGSPGHPRRPPGARSPASIPAAQGRRRAGADVRVAHPIPNFIARGINQDRDRIKDDYQAPEGHPSWPRVFQLSVWVKPGLVLELRTVDCTRTSNRERESRGSTRSYRGLSGLPSSKPSRKPKTTVRSPKRPQLPNTIAIPTSAIHSGARVKCTPTMNPSPTKEQAQAPSRSRRRLACFDCSNRSRHRPRISLVRAQSPSAAIATSGAVPKSRT
jgi:hypothetical protein